VDEPSEPQILTADAIPTRNRRHDLLALALLAVIAAVCFGDVLAGINQFYMRDLTRYYYPAKQVLREIVQHGEFPYWNRYFSGGQPIAANPEHEVFYPLTWLILLPSYDLGFRLHILLHVFIGLFGMYCLLRSMELRPFPAFFGALSWGLGGLYMSYINLLPILFCAAWIPLTCLYVRRFLLRRSARDFALASLFLGLQFLVGEPTTVMQTGLLIGMYALYRGWYSTPRISKSITRVLWIAAMSVAAIAVGAAQMIPALDHVHDSARSRTFDFDLVSAWSMPWAKFTELLYPNVLGHISLDRVTLYWGGGLYPGMGSPFIFSIYCGLFATALVVGGAFIRPRGGRLVLIVCVVSILLALGGHTPLLHWLYKAGIATSVRYPEKFILMAIFAMILFAAKMLDRLLRGDHRVAEGALGFSLAVFIVALLVSLSTATPLYAHLMTRLWVLTPGAGANHIISVSGHDWILAALRAAAVVGLLMTVRSGRRKMWMTALTLFVCLDILPIANEVNPRMPRRFFDPPPVTRQLPPNHADYRVFHEADWYGTEETARKYFSTGSAVYWIVRNGVFPMTPAGAGVRTVLERDYDKTALLPTIDLTDSIWDLKRSGRADWYQPFMAMSNAWYRAVYRPFEGESKRVHGKMEQAVPVMFMPALHYPRYYFADQLVTIRDRQDFVADLTKNSYSDRVAFVARPSFVPGGGIVRSVRETANHATIDVESFGESFLVMSVTPHKYWRLTVDGRSVPAVVTNIAYQGTVITPGRHRVEMQYVNSLVQIGLAVSLATILILGVMVLLRHRQPELATGLDAYEEPVHVVADPGGMHVEPVVQEPPPPDEEALPSDEAPPAAPEPPPPPPEVVPEPVTDAEPEAEPEPEPHDSGQ